MAKETWVPDATPNGIMLYDEEVDDTHPFIVVKGGDKQSREALAKRVADLLNKPGE